MFTNLAVKVFYFFLTTKSWGAYIAILHIDFWARSEILAFSYNLLTPFPRPLWVLADYLYF